MRASVPIPVAALPVGVPQVSPPPPPPEVAEDEELVVVHHADGDVDAGVAIYLAALGEQPLLRENAGVTDKFEAMIRAQRLAPLHDPRVRSYFGFSDSTGIIACGSRDEVETLVERYFVSLRRRLWLLGYRARVEIQYLPIQIDDMRGWYALVVATL